MPPTRKLSRSKQSDDTESNETSNDNLTNDKIDDKIVNDKSSIDDEELNDKEDNKRRGRPRRNTATASDLLNEITSEIPSTNCNSNKNNNEKKQQTVPSSPTSTRNTRSNLSPEKKDSEIKLRRRDRIRGTERYSPEIHEPVRRSKRPSFPSTSVTQNKYINLEGIDDEQTAASTSDNQNNSSGSQLLHTKKMLLKRSASTMLDEQSQENESKTYLVNLKKDNNEVILVMRDGRTLRIEKQNVTKKQRTSSKQDDDDYEMESVEEDDENDSDYEGNDKITKSSKRKSTTTKNTRLSKSMKSNETDDQPATEKKAQATGIKMSKQIRKATKQQLLSSKLAGCEETTTRITTPTGQGKTVTVITTPRSISVTPTTNTYLSKNTNTYVKRNYGSNAKYLNEIPDVNECTLEDVNPEQAILPDKILLINSDLPLEHSLNTENKDNVFLFNQIVSAINEFKCLLCIKETKFKEEDELAEHYKQIHELQIEQQSAKFSEDTVFVCLPKSIIEQLNSEDTSSTLILDAPCQYCGDDQKLATVDDMREHYKDAHMKEIKIVEQEEILEMYEVLFCSVCQLKSKDFKSHYKHMKEEHKMQIYICKQCPFFSRISNRLVTHFHAKHLMSNKNQNLQCSFCNGILIGTDRMNKHIMTSHCVQTGQNEYSCMLCLQPCEKSDQLLAHSYHCQRKYNESLASAHKEKIPTSEQAKLLANAEQEQIEFEHEENNKFRCFLCDRSFKTEEQCNLHLNHVHTKWTSHVVVNDTFLMVQHKDGKTDLMPNKQNSKTSEEQLMTTKDLPSNKELELIGGKTQYGYYCSKCECVIKIYQLFYLHMHNFHKMNKQFECKITSCKKQFKTHEEFRGEHIDNTNHPQKSVIENPLLSIACHNCDSYFINNKDIEQHLLSDEHYNKVVKNTDRSGIKSEARNYKCKTCHTWFGLFDSFIYHMENESHKHGCPHCGLHFALPSSRRTHIQSIHSDRSDICELCSEKQGTKERLFAHLVTHNLVFECNKCMRKFYQREQLNNHMETHGEPLNCPWPKCERKVNRTALSNHIRQHKVENSLKCYACDRLFSNKSQLLSHVEVHNTAEANAKIIMANASKTPKSNQTNSAQKPKTGQIHLNTTKPLNTLSSQPVETTLISITTASVPNKQRTYGNRSLSNSSAVTNKANNSVANRSITLNSSNKSQIESPMVKIMCYTCNTQFPSHNELQEHKCTIPIVTITKNEISNILNNKKIELSDQNEPHQLILTTNDKLNTINGNALSIDQQCFLMTEDSGIKHTFILQPTSNIDLIEKSNINNNSNNNTGRKKIISNAQTNSSTSTSSSHNRFMESNKKTYDFQNRAKKNYLKNKSQTTSNMTTTTTTATVTSPVNSQQHQINQSSNVNQLLVNETSPVTSVLKQDNQQHQQIFIETQSPINQQAQLILTDSNQLASLNSNLELDSNTVSTIQALIQDNNQLIATGNEDNNQLIATIDQNSIIMQDQPVVTTTNTSIPTTSTTTDQLQETNQLTDEQLQQTAVEQQIPESSQLIMIQQEDGQCVQICIPEGMDIEEVIKNLNLTWQSDAQGTTVVGDQQATQYLDTQQILEQQQLIADQVNQQMITENAQLITTESAIVDEQQQINLDSSTVEQLQSGEQQIIYLPVNEDGTMNIDAESLAMLTSNGGELPITIVSSSN